MKQNLLSLCLLLQMSFINTEHSILICTLPKTGTNLLIKLSKLILKQDKFLHLEALKKNLATIPCALYWTHAWHESLEQKVPMTLEPNDNKIEFLKENNIKLVLILRDPREHVLSVLRSLRKRLNHRNIQWAINSFPALLKRQTGDVGFLKYKDINECYYAYLQWVDVYSQVYITYFEKLVGAKGGGNKQEQEAEIKNITHFMEIDLSAAEITDIAHKLFGGTHTFKQGQIASWKKHFSAANKDLFKKIAGQLLIHLGYETDLNW